MTVSADNAPGEMPAAEPTNRPNGRAPEQPWWRTWAPSIAISAVAGVLLVIHVMGPPNGRTLDKTALYLLVLGALPWLLPVLGSSLQSMKLFGAEFTFLQRKVEAQAEVLRYIHDALRLVLTQYELQHLREIASGRPTPCKFDEFLEREMVRLCQHGFVKERGTGDVWRMKEAKSFDLNTYFVITSSGQRYLQDLSTLYTLIGAAKLAGAPSSAPSTPSQAPASS